VEQIERRKRKRVYNLFDKWQDAFTELTDSDLSNEQLERLAKIFAMEIKTDILLDRTHE